MLPALQAQLAAITARARLRARRTTAALCGLVLVAIGVGGLALTLTTGLHPGWLLLTLLVLAAASFLVVHLHSKAPPTARVVREIERNHPELQTALLAATENRPQPGQPPDDDFLRHRLELALSYEAAHGGWDDTASPGQLARLSVALWITAAITAALFLTFLALGLRRTILPSTTTTAADTGLTVEPGSIEIERGTPVAVLARFATTPPDRVTLEIGPDADHLTPTRLDRNLDDPVFATTVPPVQTDLVYRVTTDAGLTSQVHTISVFEFPKITRLDATLQPPGNPESNPPKTIENTRAITAPEGTLLTLTITTNQPIAAADLTPEKGTAIPLTVDPTAPTRLTTTFVLTQSTRYTIDLTDPADRRNQKPERFDVKVTKAVVPKFEIALPQRDARVTPIEEVAFQIDVKHRAPLADRGLTITVADSPPETIALGPAPSAKTPTPIRHLLRLEPRHVQPNDLITWFAWAEDTAPDGTPRRTEGELQFTSVRHFEETFRRLEANSQPGENLCVKLIKTQKEIVTSTWNLHRNPTPPRIDSDAPLIRDSEQIAIDIVDELQTILTDPHDLVILREAREDMTAALATLGSLIERTDPDLISLALESETQALAKLLQLSGKDWLMLVSKDSAPGDPPGPSQFDIDVAPIDDRYEANQAATAEADPEGAAARQILSRLRDLANRQKDLNAAINELLIALQRANDETEREDLQRQLAKLRQEQLENLAELDRLTQPRPELREQPPKTAQQSEMESARRDLNAAAEALEKSNPAEALANGRRAEEKLEDLRRDLEAQAANAFADELRNLRTAARDLAEEQRAISQALTDTPPQSSPTERQRPDLTDTTPAPTDLPGRLTRQREQLAKTTAALESLAEETAPTEPLLADNLTDALRETARAGTEQTLERASRFSQAGSPTFAKTASDQAAESLDQLAADIATAAASILGSEEKALRFAQSELDQLTQQITENNPSPPTPGESPSPGQSPGPPATASNPGQAPSTSPPPITNHQSPITGPTSTHSAWSDRLRNVEELIDLPEVRDSIAQAREFVRSTRRDAIRGSRDPQWDLVATEILAPLAEAQTRLREQLARLTKEDPLVPIERDPVPAQYTESVKTYYEQLAR